MIDHASTITTKQVNGSKLHLNKRGTRILFSNFKKPDPISTSDSFYYIVPMRGNHSLNEHYAKFFKNIRDVQSLKYICMPNKNIIIMGHLHINSLRNKFSICGYLDFPFTLETKLDNKFLISQLKMVIIDYMGRYSIKTFSRGRLTSWRVLCWNKFM